MDATALQTAGLTSGAITIILIVYKVLAYLKGKRLVSECCKRKVSIGFDVREMKESPSEKAIVEMTSPIPDVKPMETKSVSIV